MLIYLQSLDRIARTDLSLLSERTLFQTWVPSFNWNNLLSQAQVLFQSGNVEVIMVWCWNGLRATIPMLLDMRTCGQLLGLFVPNTLYVKLGVSMMRKHISLDIEVWKQDSVPGEIPGQLINVQIGRADIAKRKLGLIAQRERNRLGDIG